MKIPKAKKLPSGSWTIELKLGGKRIRVTRGSKAQCEKEAALIKAQHKAGVAEAKFPIDKKKLSAEEAVISYTESRTAVLSPSTIRGYKEILRNRFKGYMKLPAVSVDWQRAVNEEAKVCSAKTLKNAWGLIRSALAASGIPVEAVRIPQVVPNEHSFLEPEQIKQLIELVKDTEYEAAVLLGLHGLRKSEIYALERKDIRDGFIHVRSTTVLNSEGKAVTKKTTKTVSSNRLVPIIIPRLTEILPKEGKICADVPSSTYRRIRRTAEQNGLPSIGFHSLRHSFCSLCYHMGISELETMKLGGWSDITVMKKIYTHLASKDRSEAADKLRNFFTA